MKQIVFLIVALGVSDGFAQEVTKYSLPEFAQASRQWDRMQGKTIRVEGRYSSFTPSALRFQNCDLTFYLPAETRRPLGRSKVIEVTGEFRRNQNELQFFVNSVQSRPSDIDQLQIAKSLLPTNDAVPWYQLGLDNVKKGEFYEDDLLIKMGNDILVKGISIERSRQKNPDAEFLQKLAAKASDLGIPEQLQKAIQHDSYRLQLKQAESIKNYSYSDLRKQMEAALPGCLVPLEKPDPKLAENYSKDPTKTFSEATTETQKLLSRLLYLNVLQTEYHSRLSPGGANGDQLAKEYASLAPDNLDFAEELREAALMFRSKNIVTSTRAEVLGVAEDYRRQNQPELAQTALKKWLEHREGQLDKAGPTDFLQTAIDYDDWFSQRDKAEKILLSGIEKYPNDPPLQALLKRWEFVKQDGKWIPESEMKKTKPDRIQQAIQTGRIVTGMTPEQVVSALGAPKTMTQLASKNKNLLIWKFSDVGLVIHFEQRHANAGYAVSKVGPLP